MDVALSGQWSGMPSFYLIIYSYFSIKVFIVNIWLHNGLQFQKVLFWEEMHHFLFLANWSLWMLVRSGQWSGMPSFSLIIYSYFLIKVFIAWISHHNGLQFQKVLFWKEMYEFYFVANWWLWMLLSVVSDQVCPVFL